MKHILLPLMLLPAILFAQKATTEKIIKLPIYDAKLPTDDVTNMVWVDSADLKAGVKLEFENPDIKVASFKVVANSKREILTVQGVENKLPTHIAPVLLRAYEAKDVITFHIEKIYLKGTLRTANWTYRIRVR